MAENWLFRQSDKYVRTLYKYRQSVYVYSGRIGILDRKLRIVNENAKDDEEWMNWVIRAFQSCYGYDYSGDNVLLARENLLYTFIEYVEDRTGEKATMKQLKKIANIISWNIWQMNGITMTAPYSLAKSSYEQMSFF